MQFVGIKIYYVGGEVHLPSFSNCYLFLELLLLISLERCIVYTMKQAKDTQYKKQHNK